MKEFGATAVRRLLRTPRSGLRAGWAALALLLLLHPPAAAQRSAAELEVVRAALPHLRQSLPAGPAALDPEGFCEARLIGWDCPAGFREAADSLGFRLSGRAFTLVCLGGPRSCRLVGAASLVVLSPPEVSRRDATLDAAIWRRPGSGGRPIAESHVRLTLARGPGGWEVVREDPLPGGVER